MSTELNSWIRLNSLTTDQVCLEVCFDCVERR